MPKVGKTPRRVISLYPAPELKELLEERSKKHCVSLNEYCLNLISRGMLAEDVEGIHDRVDEVIGKIQKTKLGGLLEVERHVLLEILGYMRVTFAKDNPALIQQARTFADKMLDEMGGDEDVER